MIQRIQTIYLLVALALSVSLFFIPFYHFAPTQQPLSIAINNYLYILAGIICAECLVAIFTFKYRKIQKNICMALILFQLVYIGMGFLFVKQHLQSIDFHLFGWSAILPLVSIVFIMLAIRGINKDEKLIRSMDRLR